MSQPSPTPALGCGSAVHHALAIPEVLKLIFGFGTRASNVSYVLVCRSWAGPALDNVWRKVDDIYYLLQLLAPMQTGGGFGTSQLVSFYVLCSRMTQTSKTQVCSQEFSRSLTLKDWTRFTPYARRVHTLKYRTDLNEKSWRIGDKVFFEVARTRPTLEVLPNLRSLWWNANPQDANLFMHDKFTEFVFQFCSEGLSSLRTDIVRRMPSLRSLGWTNPPDKGRYSDQDILQLISGLQMLREVTPPMDDLGGKFLKELSSLLPELEAIRFNNNLPRTPLYSDSCLECKLQEGAFPKLYDLCLKCDLDDIRVYLTGGALLPRLRNLSVEGRGTPELPLTVQQFFTDVTRCYPTLEMVSMNVMVSAEEEDLDIDEFHSLSREHLNPIFSLKQLIHLELRHNRPLQISEDDLKEFGSALPALEKLVLNPEPLHLTRPEITLHSLLIVAQHFPKLIYLGIYLDVQDATIPAPKQLPPKIQLSPSLVTLHMGVSPIASHSEVPVAMFLSHILSGNESVKIKSGISWNSDVYDSEESGDYQAAVSERCSKWDRVADSLSLLLQLRKEEGMD